MSASQTPPHPPRDPPTYTNLFSLVPAYDPPLPTHPFHPPYLNLQAAVVGVALWCLYAHVFLFYLNVWKLRHIPGPLAVPVLGCLWDPTALISVRIFLCWLDWCDAWPCIACIHPPTSLSSSSTHPRTFCMQRLVFLVPIHPLLYESSPRLCLFTPMTGTPSSSFHPLPGNPPTSTHVFFLSLPQPTIQVTGWLAKLRPRYGKIIRVFMGSRPYVVLMDKAAAREAFTDPTIFTKVPGYKERVGGWVGGLGGIYACMYAYTHPSIYLILHSIPPTHPPTHLHS